MENNKYIVGMTVKMRAFNDDVGTGVIKKIKGWWIFKRYLIEFKYTQINLFGGKSKAKWFKPIDILEQIDE